MSDMEQPEIVITPSTFDIADVRLARATAYREGFAAGAEAMREKCARAIGDLRTADTVTARAVVIDGMRAIRSLPLPTPTDPKKEGDQ